jgi:two-component system, OmpR family, KDP operon response regulator KdpE
MTTAPRVLLVEDNELNRALVRAILSRTSDPVLRGADLIEAHNLTQARAVLGREAIDIVLLDVQLPDGNGLALVDEITARGGHRPAVIAVTGGVLPEQRAAAMAAGCNAIVDKPFIAADLVNALSTHLPTGRT